MIHIPGGRFFMGSDDDLPNERPAHQVSLGGYCMDEHEVTTAQYKACSDDGGCKRAAANVRWAGASDLDKKTYDSVCTMRDPEKLGSHPINCVDWGMADRFCRAQGKRLPTEAEWEFAARGPDGRRYPWGDDEPSATLVNGCGAECVVWSKKNHADLGPMFAGSDRWATTAPVGSFPAGKSRYGVQDIVGNVWEWTADWYGPYGPADASNPTGTGTGDERVIRGGAWNTTMATCARPSYRWHDAPDTRSHGVGFRCAK
jgi:formylglycine-generating enzyme required for sulfatase activity